MVKSRENEEFEVVDIHVHSASFSDDADMNIEQILKISKEKDYEVGIADHASKYRLIENDKDLKDYIMFLDKFPVYKGIELEVGDEFAFSKTLLERLDYVIGGLHLLEHRGKLINFCDPNAKISNVCQFMQNYLITILEALEARSINILAHPTYLPISLRKCNPAELFHKDWINALISGAIEYNVVLEINNRHRLPHREFLEECLKEGVMFSLGSDGHKKEEICQLDYPLEMVTSLGISLDHLYNPGSLRRS